MTKHHRLTLKSWRLNPVTERVSTGDWTLISWVWRVPWVYLWHHCTTSIFILITNFTFPLKGKFPPAIIFFPCGSPAPAEAIKIHIHLINVTQHYYFQLLLNLSPHLLLSAGLSRPLGHRHPDEGVPGDHPDQLLLPPVQGPGRPGGQHHVPTVRRAVMHHQPHLQYRHRVYNVTTWSVEASPPRG